MSHTYMYNLEIISFQVKREINSEFPFHWVIKELSGKLRKWEMQGKIVPKDKPVLTRLGISKCFHSKLDLSVTMLRCTYKLTGQYFTRLK